MQPDSIHGPVLLTAENFKDEEYVQVSAWQWAQLQGLGGRPAEVPGSCLQ